MHNSIFHRRVSRELMELWLYFRLKILSLESTWRYLDDRLVTKERQMRRLSYLTVLIHVVVRQFHLLEGDNLLPQLLAGERGVGMHVKPRRCRRIRFASFQPATTMIGVSIPLVVDRYDVHQDGVTAVRFKSAEGHPARRKHSPVKKKKETSYM